jgi:hypothetical protein
MASTQSESYFVFMNYDPEYQRLRADRSVPYLHNYLLYVYICIYVYTDILLLFLEK